MTGERKEAGKKNIKTQKNQVGGLVLLLLPPIILVVVLYFASSALIQEVVDSNDVLSFIINDTPVSYERPTVAEPEVIEAEGEGETVSGKYAYGAQWATLQADGWERRDIPVYVGDEDYILNEGAGLHFGTHYCGEEGNIVISGRAAEEFYELEDTQIGDKITLHTNDGAFCYEVTKIRKLMIKNDEVFLAKNKDNEETLVLTTTYPRSVPYGTAVQRLVVECKRVSVYDGEDSNE